MAKIIAEGEVLTKEIPAEKIDERIKYYNGLKNEDTGQLADLSLLAAKFRKMHRTLGSSKYSFDAEDAFPSLDTTLGAAGAEKPIDVLDVMEKVGS